MTSTAALPAAGAAYPLVGCTVAPDSALSKFELAERAYLTTKFPNARNLIHRFT
jgi:predicted cupin superfamily sugar epimerase